MFRLWNEPDKNQVRYEGTIEGIDYLDKKIGQHLREVVCTKLADTWIEQYGAALLEKIAPEEVEKAIKDAVAKRILGDKQ